MEQCLSLQVTLDDYLNALTNNPENAALG